MENTQENFKKILVVWYSRTNNTKDLGQEMADKLGADTDQITEKKSRKGAIGWLSAGRDAMRKAKVEIEFKKDPAKYEVVIIGTPVWVGTATPAVCTYLEKNKEKIKQTAFFCTAGSDDGQKAFNEMATVLGKKPIATLAIKAKELKNSQAQGETWKFCEQIIKG